MEPGCRVAARRPQAPPHPVPSEGSNHDRATTDGTCPTRRGPRPGRIVGRDGRDPGAAGPGRAPRDRSPGGHGHGLGAGRRHPHLRGRTARAEPDVLLRQAVAGRRGAGLPVPALRHLDPPQGRQGVQARRARERVRPGRHPPGDRRAAVRGRQQDQRLPLLLPPARDQAGPDRPDRRLDLGRDRVEHPAPPPRLDVPPGAVPRRRELRREQDRLGGRAGAAPPDALGRRVHAPARQVVSGGGGPGREPDARGQLDALLRQRGGPRQ